MRTELVVGDKVWPTISRLSKRAGPRYAAVAFVGIDAPSMMTLKRGDVLVVNAGRSALGVGATHPDALQAYVDRGVLVYSLPTLHAKVFANRDSAVVGSANASAHSRRAEEAVVVLRTKSAVREVHEYVAELATLGDLANEDFITDARKHFRPVTKKYFPGVTGHDHRGLIRGSVGALWVIGYEEAPSSPAQDKWNRRALPAQQRAAGPSSRFRVGSFVTEDSAIGVHDGDVVIFVVGDRDWHVLPPEVVQGEEEQLPDGLWGMFSRRDVHLESDVTWQALVTKLGESSDWHPPEWTHQITSDQMKRAVLEMWGLETAPTELGSDARGRHH